MSNGADNYHHRGCFCLSSIASPVNGSVAIKQLLCRSHGNVIVSGDKRILRLKPKSAREPSTQPNFLHFLRLDATPTPKPLLTHDGLRSQVLSKEKFFGTCLKSCTQQEKWSTQTELWMEGLRPRVSNRLRPNRLCLFSTSWKATITLDSWTIQYDVWCFLEVSS